MNSERFLAAANARYVSLATFRRDGREVATPVWIVTDGGRAFFVTDRTTGKFKRLRDGGRVRFAPCDSRGRQILGDWEEASARLLLDTDHDLKQTVERAFVRKYGWSYRAIIWGYRLLRKYGLRVCYELSEGSG